MASVSVVISAYNEEDKIEKTLESVSWADEVIVVDNSSTDATSKISKKHGAKVFKRPNNPMLNVNKNFGFTKAKSDWILNLDADEVITKELAQEIQRVLKQTPDDIVGYWISRKNIIFGKWIQHGLWWPDKQLRLFQKGSGAFACKHVHEYVEIEGKTEHLKEPYIHYNYDSVSQFLYKMEHIYTNSEVEKLIESQYVVVWHDALRFPISDFVKVYFAQRAYKDGLHGLVLSILQAFYAFVVFTKLWEKKNFSEIDIHPKQITQELQWVQKELVYWNTSKDVEETRNPLRSIVLRIKRKLQAH